MGLSRKRYSPDEIRTIRQLHKEGYTHQQIADKVRPGVKTAWRSIGEMIRKERKAKVLGESATQPAAYSIVPPSQPSTKITLPSIMADSLTAKEFMTMMNDDQRALFVAHYEDLRGDADEEALTRAENEMLIRASYSNVKYLRAQSLLNTSESYLMADMEGGLSDSDADKAKRRFAGNREMYKKEVEQWHKEYMELVNDLKLTRKQRLDKIKDTRNTFLDLQQELTDQLKRDSIVEDIKRINRLTEDEFRRMARGDKGPDGRVYNWLLGAFSEYISDEPPKEGDDENRSLSDSKPEE